MRAYISRVPASKIMFTITAAITITLLSTSSVSASSQSTTVLASSGLDSKGANRHVDTSSINTTSSDGRISVYATGATNIVPDDLNDTFDVFAYDRITKKTELISRDAQGEPGNNASFTPTISSDGRYVAYVTGATDIIPNADTFCAGVQFFCPNIIVYDRTAKTIRVANRTATGQRIPNFLNDLTGTPPIISGNGRYVAYYTDYAVDSKDLNSRDDVVVHDLQTGQTKTGSVNSSGVAMQQHVGFSISDDGRYVAFSSDSPKTSPDANNNYDNFLHDFTTGKTTLISANPQGKPGNAWSFNPVISGDGNFVAFVSNSTDLAPGDTNSTQDIYVRDLQASKTRRVSVSTRAATANGGSLSPSISKDGRHIVFSSWATNLVRNDKNQTYDIFIHDRLVGITRRVNVTSHNGLESQTNPFGSGGAFEPTISRDGKAVTYISDATNLDNRIGSNRNPNFYISYNPNVNIPYYDPNDFINIIQP